MKKSPRSAWMMLSLISDSSSIYRSFYEHKTYTLIYEYIILQFRVGRIFIIWFIPSVYSLFIYNEKLDLPNLNHENIFTVYFLCFLQLHNSFWSSFHASLLLVPWCFSYVTTETEIGQRLFRTPVLPICSNRPRKLVEWVLFPWSNIAYSAFFFHFIYKCLQREIRDYIRIQK